ncbi:hypothetical protein H4582DRAFT_1951667 [Lactarius indigo]|nr:hypothetical protein H4582DRAFT_1951667 [Lactarius indigo]
MLGGGYSFKSNEYGLSIDNVVAFELVLPNGTVTTVTAEDHDLWFALRGGGNNFGIVTKFTLQSYSQGQVWGGTILFGSDQLGAVKNAITEFGKVTDPNATLGPGFRYSSGEVISAVTLFYNAPQPPSGIFDAILRIPNQQQDTRTRSYADFVKNQATQTTSPIGLRGHYCGFPTANYSLNFLDAITDQVLVRILSCSSVGRLYIIFSNGARGSHLLMRAWPSRRRRTLLIVIFSRMALRLPTRQIVPGSLSLQS